MHIGPAHWEPTYLFTGEMYGWMNASAHFCAEIQLLLMV